MNSLTLDIEVDCQAHLTDTYHQVVQRTTQLWSVDQTLPCSWLGPAVSRPL